MRVRFRRLCARQQLALQQAWPGLLPELLRMGLSPQDAQAVAYNTAFLFYALHLPQQVQAPADLLDCLSLGQIARLCEAYEAARPGLESLRVKGVEV